MEYISLNFFNNQEILRILIMSLLVSIFLICIYKVFNIKKNIVLLMLIISIYSIVSFTRLGSYKMPETYWQPVSNNEEIIFHNTDELEFDTIYAISGLGDTNNSDDYQLLFHDIKLLGSFDLSNWYDITTLSHDDNGFLKWKKTIVNPIDYTYIKLVSSNKYSVINELGIKNSSTNEFIPMTVYTSSNSDNPYLASNIIDEVDSIPDEISYYDETFFDEIYHARNALEIAKGQLIYSHVHPLLGTGIIALGIQIFGMNPFGFRFMGALFGVLMLPLIYLIGNKLFKNERLSLIATLLMSVDFMHLTTSRIATLEPFSVFFILLMYYFMIDFVSNDFTKTSYKKLLIKLGLAGLAMSLGWACKWTVIYASVGLAIMLFVYLFNEYNKVKYNSTLINIYKKRFVWTIIYCFIMFVFLPYVIYNLAYVYVVLSRIPANGLIDYLVNVYEYTIGIFNYHVNLQATHPFQSEWYHWIINAKPIWYYITKVDGVVKSISCFNNPLISIVGIVGVIYTLYSAIVNKSNSAFIICLGYFSSLLPNVFIGRCLFSYHYYPAYPFLILAIVYMIMKAKLNINNEAYVKRLTTIFLGISVFLFVIFLPIITGFSTTDAYINGVLRWFEGWNFS